MTTRQEHYKNDFELELLFRDASGAIVPPPAQDWIIEARTSRIAGKSSYTIEKKGDRLTHAYVNAAGNIVAVFDRHALGVGELLLELRIDYPDTNYSDSICTKYYLVESNTTLTRDYTDTRGAVNIRLAEWITYDELQAKLAAVEAALADVKNIAAAEQQRKGNELQRQQNEAERNAAFAAQAQASAQATAPAERG